MKHRNHKEASKSKEYCDSDPEVLDEEPLPKPNQNKKRASRCSPTTIMCLVFIVITIVSAMLIQIELQNRNKSNLL